MRDLEGKYTIAGSIWPMPGLEPMTFTGTAENMMILGGRFLQLTSLSGENSMLTETFGLLGFDRRFGHYTSVGYDTWGTYYVTAVGTVNEDGTQITMYGEDEDPVTSSTQKYDFVYDILGNGNYMFSVIFYDSAHTQGEEKFKMVEITYTRK